MFGQQAQPGRRAGDRPTGEGHLTGPRGEGVHVVHLAGPDDQSTGQHDDAGGQEQVATLSDDPGLHGETGGEQQPEVDGCCPGDDGWIKGLGD